MEKIANEPGLERRVHSFALRMLAVLAAVAIILVGGTGHDSALAIWTSIAYLVAVVLLAAMFLADRLATPPTTFVVLDAVFVTLVLFENILAAPVTDDHGLTTTGLVIPFILLSHVGMNLNARLVVIFSSIVLAAWLAMLGVMALRHEFTATGTFLGAFLDLDLALAISFGIAAISTWLLATDHDRTRKEALKIDRWRHNLARFFSPLVVADLQEAGKVLDLTRRPAAVMFIDLREFTAYAETAPPPQLAGVLAAYRRLVAGTIFSFGGTVDKFIGDGVMAVFGQPTAANDDAERALACALELIAVIGTWRPFADGPVFQAGIGLHHGTVIGGVLESGYHDEFTVIGDVVNVAQRLESLTKDLDASLVVSHALLARTRQGVQRRRWVNRKGVALAGRRFPVDIAYLPRG